MVFIARQKNLSSAGLARLEPSPSVCWAGAWTRACSGDRRARACTRRRPTVIGPGGQRGSALDVSPRFWHLFVPSMVTFSLLLGAAGGAKQPRGGPASWLQRAASTLHKGGIGADVDDERRVPRYTSYMAVPNTEAGCCQAKRTTEERRDAVRASWIRLLHLTPASQLPLHHAVAARSNAAKY